MSKRNLDGDVLGNRVNLGLAKSQKLLASMLGPAPESHATTAAIPEVDEDDYDFKKDFVDPEQLGVGGMRPKDIADGSFTRRTLTSNDKLLEQLIGKKKAKIHLASKQQATRLGAQSQPKNGRQASTKKEESEDEEEGRSAAFTSKRRKVAKPKPVPVTEDEDEIEPPAQAVDEAGDEQAHTNPPAIEEPEEDEQPPVKPKSIPSRSKAKSKSYLDEVLAERSKKKKKKAT